MIGDNLDKYSYSYLLKSCLSRVPDTVDKREGSIISDALSPACMELANYYVELKRLVLETYALTASGQWLDYRVAEQGLTRFSATKAVKRGKFETSNGSPMIIPMGSRFSTIDEINPLIYKVMAPYTNENEIVIDGMYLLQCETDGTAGNSYVGSIVPVTYIQGLAKAFMDLVVVPARNIETDDELRARYLLAVNDKPFGGNIADYDQKIKEIDGVGELQVYPVWNGGGTVKVSIIDASYDEISSDFISKLQNIIDPDNVPGGKGTGLGLAPIGHNVTVTTPTVLRVNITCDVKLLGGFTINQIQEPVVREIEEYMLTLRKNWGIGDELNRYQVAVYLSQINSAILRVPGVANVTNTMLNGQPSDIELRETGLIQELPKLGTVTLNKI